jgi:hypothetical protein
MTSTFHISEEELPLLQELLEAKATALDHGDPPFSQVKLRFNIGTQLFPGAAGRLWKLSDGRTGDF